MFFKEFINSYGQLSDFLNELVLLSKCRKVDTDMDTKWAARGLECDWEEGAGGNRAH